MLHPKLLFACVVLLTSGTSTSHSSLLKTTSVTAIAHQTVVSQDSSSSEVGKIELVGKWESRTFGHQTLTTRPDGTATISMRLTPLAIPIYGRKIDLDLEWTLNGRYLTHRIVGGSPERSVRKLIQKYGDTHQYLLVEHDAGQLLVKDINGHSEPVRWTTVELTP